MFIFFFQIALLITEGIQTKNKGPYTDLHHASQPLKDIGVAVATLGIGSDFDVLELVAIASKMNLVFNVVAFWDLQFKVPIIWQVICKSGKITNIRKTLLSVPNLLLAMREVQSPISDSIRFIKYYFQYYFTSYQLQLQLEVD